MYFNQAADELPLSQACDIDPDDVVEVVYDEREDGLLHVLTQGKHKRWLTRRCVERSEGGRDALHAGVRAFQEDRSA